MGTIRNGANGGFSGKAGSVVGSSWNNINYIKGLSKISKKPATQAQIDQRLRFALVMRYLAPIKDILNIGYKGQTAGRQTGSNMAVQIALSNAIIGDYPDYSIDKSKVEISKGTLAHPDDVVVLSVEAGKLTVSWAFTAEIEKSNEGVDDKLAVVIYNEERDSFISYKSAAMRNAQQVNLPVPVNYSGQEVFIYVFFVDKRGTCQSKSIYLGATTII